MDLAEETDLLRKIPMFAKMETSKLKLLAFASEMVFFEDGDIVGLDMGVVREEYYGDSARTIPVGRVSSEIERLIRVTKEAMFKGIEQAIDGNRVGDIGHAVQGYAEGFGFSIVRDLFGHGVGRQLHEEPQIPNYGKPGR